MPLDRAVAQRSRARRTRPQPAQPDAHRSSASQLRPWFGERVGGGGGEEQINVYEAAMSQHAPLPQGDPTDNDLARHTNRS